MNKRQILMTSCLCVWLALNLLRLYKDNQRIENFRKDIAHQHIGEVFHQLKPFTKDIESMGYYTDRDITVDQNAAKDFAHAQYLLAPTVLELNSLDHEYTFFNCKNPKLAISIIKAKGFELLKGNARGMLLTKRP